MGLTWITGVLFFDSSLIPFAYIFTIFAAFQVLSIITCNWDQSYHTPIFIGIRDICPLHPSISNGRSGLKSASTHSNILYVQVQLAFLKWLSRLVARYSPGSEKTQNWLAEKVVKTQQTNILASYRHLCNSFVEEKTCCDSKA